MADYSAAYNAYERSGNLAQVARELNINENSLRDFARRHCWKEDRSKTLAQQAEMAERLGGTIGRLVSELETTPTVKQAQKVREVARLAPLLNGVTSEAEGAAQSYTGDKDGYRTLLLAALKDAMRSGKQSLVGQYLDLLGKLDGHVKGTGKDSGNGVPLPDFQALAALGAPSEVRESA